MKTITFNAEIKETDKENGKLKDSFKLNAEVNFMKSLLDYVKEGNDITILKVLFSESIIETQNDVEVIDPDTKEKKILKEKVYKNCYSCTGVLKTHEYKKGEVKKSTNELMPRMTKGMRLGEGRK